MSVTTNLPSSIFGTGVMAATFSPGSMPDEVHDGAALGVARAPGISKTFFT